MAGIKLFSLLISFITIISFNSCTSSEKVAGTISSTEDGTIGLFGIITSDSGVPLGGVTVLVYNDSDAVNSVAIADTVTDDNGRYTFPYLASGVYNIEAEKKSDGVEFNLLLTGISYDSVASAETGLNVGTDTLKLSGTITGSVSLGLANNSGVEVYIPGTSFYGISGVNGEFTISDVASGIGYSLVYNVNGFYDTTISEVNVVSDSVTNIPLVEMKTIPQAFWALDGNAEEENELYSGTLMGTVDTTDRFDNASKALYFDKASIIKIPDNSTLAFTESFTISLWYYKTAHDSSDRDFLVFRGAAESGMDSYFLALEKSGEWVFHIEDESGNSNKLYLQSSDEHFGKWIHIAAVFNSDDKLMKLYFDGTEVASQASTVMPFGQISNTEIFIRIGGYKATSSFGIDGETGLWLGNIDDVQLFNTALTAGQVKILSNIN